MHYYTEKSVEYRLAGASRTEKNANFLHEARAVRQRRSELLRSMICRFTIWTPLQLCVAAPDAPSSHEARSTDMDGSWSW